MILAQDSALLFVINNKINNKRIWDLFIKQIKSNLVAAIVFSRFSMYAATVIVPFFYKFNIDETIEACSNISFRTKRNRLKNNYDFVAGYIGLACKEQTKFVSECFEIGFQPLAQYISNFENYPFPELRSVTNNIESITALKDFLLSHFDIFNFENLNESEQNNIFVITFVYYYTLLKFHRFPPEIKFDRSAFFNNNGKILIEFCLKTNITS